MKLPATWVEAVEAEAMAFALEWIAWHRTEANGIFHPNASEIYGKGWMKILAQRYPAFADEILYLAERGNRDAREALRELAMEYAHRNEIPPPAVGTYAIRVLGSLRREPSKRGPGKAGNLLRDCGIALLVMELMDRFKLAARRNTESRKPSASSIAADALGKAGIASLSFKGVEKIWGRYLPELPMRYAIGTKFAAGFPAGYRGLFD